MQSVIISVAVGLLAFAMGLVGLYLKQRLPERHMSMGSQGNRKAYEQHFETGDYLSKFEKWNGIVASLAPHTPQQTELLSSIRSTSASFQQTRLLMSEQLASSISWPLVVIVVGWALLLFSGFGVMSGLNLTSVVALALGAFAVATAIFLILELNQPFSGLLHVPTMSIEATLKALETPPAKR
jgi:hypothetical protein